MLFTNTICLSLSILYIVSSLSSGEVTPVKENPVAEWNQLLVDACVKMGKAPPKIIRKLAILNLGFRHVVQAGAALTEDKDGDSCPLKDRLLMIFTGETLVTLLEPSIKDQVEAKTAEMLAEASPEAHCSKEAIDALRATASKVADDAFQSRVNDGSADADCQYTIDNESPLAWKPVPPAFSQTPVLPCWGNVALFGTKTDVDAFTPKGPSAPTSEAFRKDWLETFEKGAVDSKTRTEEETMAAKLWDPSTFVSTFIEVITKTLAETTNIDDMKTYVDTFYLANAAAANTAIAVWRFKYKFNTIRPVTGYQNADRYSQLSGGEPLAGRPDWTPLTISSNHPEYPAGHGGLGAAYMEVLAQLKGDNHEISFERDGVTHRYTSLRALADEYTYSRIFAGVQFRTACDDARDIGIKIAKDILSQH